MTMGGTNELVTYLKKNKKARRIAVLAAVIAVLMVVLLGQMIMQPEAPPEGALRAVVCLECKTLEERRIKDIMHTDKRCTKCGGRYGYAWKCTDCKYEFAFKPDISAVETEGMKSSMRYFEKVMQMRKCPNCGSTHTCGLSISKK